MYRDDQYCPLLRPEFSHFGNRDGARWPCILRAIPAKLATREVRLLEDSRAGVRFIRQRCGGRPVGGRQKQRWVAGISSCDAQGSRNTGSLGHCVGKCGLPLTVLV